MTSKPMSRGVLYGEEQQRLTLLVLHLGTSAASFCHIAVPPTALLGMTARG